MVERAADDFTTIRSRLTELAGERGKKSICMIRSGGEVAKCWCYKAGVGGTNLPCPPYSTEPSSVPNDAPMPESWDVCYC